MGHDFAKNLEEWHVVFMGHVQGVGFRATARFYAVQLNLKGTVRNCEDGSVELVVQGAKEALQKLILLLQEEFSLDPEKDIKKNCAMPKSHYDSFRIII